MGRLVFQRTDTCLGKINRGFTLVELVVTLGVILLLSTIGIYAYFGALAHARDTVCESNIRGIKRAVDEYVLENDAFPATLGQLKIKHVEEGYAKARREMGWRLLMSLIILKLDASDHAHAQFLTHENLKKYGAKEKIFHCPADDNGRPSYGINGNLEGKRWSEVGVDEIIIADSDQYIFTSPDQLAKRHRHKALAITKNSGIIKVSGAEPAADDSAQVTDSHGTDSPQGNNSSSGTDSPYGTDNSYDTDSSEGTNSPSGTDSPVDNGTGETDNNVGKNPDDAKVTICHKGKKTLSVAKSALDAHLGHGDTMGPCP